jgi:hypothetical protein
MAVQQYPHFLFVHVVSESVQDSDGNWSDPIDSWAKHCKCREETNGAGRQINGPDGKAIVFSSVVYMPKNATKIQEGTEILVSETDSETGLCRVEGTVLKHDISQLHARLWL